MLRILKLTKSNNHWKVSFKGDSLRLDSSYDKILEALNPSNNQVCVLTDLSSDKAVCYFIKEEGILKIYSYPAEICYVENVADAHFFERLEEGVKYYVIPVE